MANDKDASMHAGDDKVLRVSVAMQGTLEGATIRWWLARIPKTPQAQAFVKKATGQGITITGEREFEVELRPADTIGVEPGKWYQEAEVVDNLGRVGTVLAQSFEIKPKLIRSA